MKLIRPGDLGGAASSTCHRSERSYLPGGPTSSDTDASPLESSLVSRSDHSSDLSFLSFISLEPAYQLAVTSSPMRSPSPADPLGAEGVYGSTDTSLLSHSLSETVDSSPTLPSSADQLSLLGHVDDNPASVEDLNSHRNSYLLLEQVEPSNDIFVNFDVDFASDDMDIIGTGEQFTGYDQISVAHGRAPFADERH